MLMHKTLRRHIVAYAVAVICVAVGIFSSCSGDPSLDGLKMPEFVSISAEAAGNSVSLNCSYKGNGVGTCGFVITKGGKVVKNLEAGSRTNGSFSLTINGLEYDTEYTYYAWISNGMAEIHSNTGTVHTEQKPEPAQVFVSVTAKAEGNTVYLTCTYEGLEADVCGFVLTKDGKEIKRQETEASEDGSFSLNIPDLEYDTEYGYYAWIVKNKEEIRSNSGTVHTEPKPVVAPAIISVYAQADENILTLYCTYQGDDVDGCGFYFNGSDKWPAGNIEEEKFSLKITNLEYDTEYEFQAYLTSGQTEVKSETMKARTGKMSSVPIADAAFKAYILGKYDLDKNGKLSMEEAEKITRLEINTYDLQIQSMEGIEYFKNLEYLKAVGHDDTRRGGLTTLDLSKNTKLQTLYCSFNKLETIDFGGNPSLKYIDCSSNMLYNVNEWDPKPDFNNLTALEYLDCHSNEGLVVFLGGNDYLKYIDCSHTVGQEFFGDCPSLEYLDISYCTIFSGGSLNISGLKSLKTLKSEGIGGFYEFDASGCVNLELDQSFFKENGSTILKLRGCSKLTSMDISVGANSTNYIDVTDCKNLKSLKCNYRVVDELYVTGSTALTELECYGNFLHELDVSSQKKLNLKAWPQIVNFDKLWIGSGEYHYFNEDGQEVDPADYGTEVIIKE